jgi:hypothetical protein
MANTDDLPVAARRHGTLVASTVASVDLGVDVAAVRILNRGGAGAAELWARVDPGVADPAVNDNSSFPVPVGGWAVERSSGSGNTVVKLLSTGTPLYTLEGLR